MFTCKICGKQFRRVCSHVWQKHQISAKDYKKMCGYDTVKGLLLPADREHMRKKTLTNGTWYNCLKHGRATQYKKGDKVGAYKRSQQSIDRLTKQIKGKGQPFKKGENQHTRKGKQP